MKLWPLLILACSDPLATVCDEAHFIQPSIIVEGTRDETASFLNQLPSGTVVINGSVYLDSLELADYVTGTNTISIQCAGGWNGGQIVGDLTLAYRGVGWEVRVDKCHFIGGTLRFEYVQESVWTGVYIQQPFRIDHASGITFRDLYAYNADITLNETGRTTFDNAHIGDSRLYIRGAMGLPNGWGGPIRFLNSHLERSHVTVLNASTVSLEGNYFFGSTLEIQTLKFDSRNNDALYTTLNGIRMGCV